MQNVKLSIDVPERSVAHHIAGVLSDVIDPPPNALTIFENGPQWLIEAYFDHQPDGAAIVHHIADVLECPVPGFRVGEVPNENWVALSQAALPPVFAGRFTVYGSHDRDRIGRGFNTLQIDAGEAFGTAHHATTYGCLLALDRLTRRRRFSSVLDLGTGSGVLALAMQRAEPQARILGTDIDVQSIVVAKANARINALSPAGDPRLQLLYAAGLDAPAIRQRAPFDLVIANILAGPLIHLAGDISHQVQLGGQILLSGILVRQAAEVIAAYRAHGFDLQRHDRIDEWATLVMVRRY